MRRVIHKMNKDINQESRTDEQHRVQIGNTYIHSTVEQWRDAHINHHDTTASEGLHFREFFDIFMYCFVYYYFKACAPLWKHINALGENNGPQPRGRCVYSDRLLTNFTILLPCSKLPCMVCC